ncbi:hypothetical protein [Cellulomonas sp. S1-8]|uniref:hypothetical protein n=1 Tax=Cellulomonas sp. S1-8 TaxID=2904790 RepID=UPI002242FCFF|nr:hypothetical protein [Cellulomonas sp. S1-8]UZN02995.1 hypothetical protein OKX07_18385 [Cellulomonas sp. S1-8]
MRDAINAQTWLLYHAAVELVQYPAQGDFAWWYQNPNQVFNAATYDWVSARVVPGDAPGLVALTPSGGFPDAYAALLADLTWTVAAADAGSPAAARQAAAALAGLARLRAVLADPPDGAGGMRTVDPVTGAIPAGTVPAYAVNTALAALADSLQGGGSTVVVRVAGPYGSVVTLTYPCCTMVPVAPSAWQPTTGRGWYAPDPVGQAYARGAGTSSGYAFVAPPAYTPGSVVDGGDLGQVVGVLLSGPPTLTVEPAPMNALGPGPDVADLEALVRGALDLLGLGRPAPPTVPRACAAPAVPLLQQRATVVGVTVGTFASAPGGTFALTSGGTGADERLSRRARAASRPADGPAR